MKKLSKTPEHWASDVFGDIFTNGWMDAYKNLWRLLVKLSSTTVLVFLRYRCGTRFVSGATIFWGYTLVSLFWIADVLIGFSNSVPMFWTYNLCFAAVALFRIIESRFNLRRHDGKARLRYGGDTGLSHLWIPFKLLFGSMGLVPKDGKITHWWQLDEFRFQRFVEPALIIFIGYLFQKIGYGAFGFYIILGGMCSYMLMQQMADAYYETKQQKWDAQVLGEVIQHSDTPLDRKKGMVVQQSLMRSDKGFEKWKAEQEAEQRIKNARVETGELSV